MKVLFLCTGNICRSPAADGILRRKLAEAGLADRVGVDSAGTHGYHAGDPPDPRGIAAARGRGYDLTGLRARRIGRDDFRAFDLIVAMDQGHLAFLEANRPAGAKAELSLMMAFAPETGRDSVPDPYYEDAAEFEAMLDLLEPAVDGLVAHIARRLEEAPHR